MDEQKKDVQPVAPGTVVTPGGAAPAGQSAPIQDQQNIPEPLPPPKQQPAPLPPPQPVQQSQAPAGQPTPAPEQPIYQADPASNNDDPDSINWTASEFVAHDKSSEWYLLLAGGTIAATGLMYILTKDFISAGVVVLASVIFAIYGTHKPRQLDYRVDLRAITIGGKTYSYDQFRSFSVIPEGAFSSIVFMPLKRFAVPITIYYAPQDEEKIVEILALQLPYEQRRRDAVDSLMRKVRF